MIYTKKQDLKNIKAQKKMSDDLDYQKLKEIINDSKPFVDLTGDLYERKRIQFYLDKYEDRLLMQLVKK